MRYDPVENNLKYQKDTIKKPLKISGLRFCDSIGTKLELFIERFTTFSRYFSRLIGLEISIMSLTLGWEVLKSNT